MSDEPLWDYEGAGKPTDTKAADVAKQQGRVVPPLKPEPAVGGKNG